MQNLEGDDTPSTAVNVNVELTSQSRRDDGDAGDGCQEKGSSKYSYDEELGGSNEQRKRTRRMDLESVADDDDAYGEYDGEDKSTRVRVVLSVAGYTIKYELDEYEDENQFQTKAKKTKYIVFGIFGFLSLCWFWVIYTIVISASRAPPVDAYDPIHFAFPSDHQERPPLSYPRGSRDLSQLLMPQNRQNIYNHQHSGAANDFQHPPRPAVLKSPEEKVWIKWLSEKEKTLEHWHAVFTFNQHGTPMDDLTVKIELFSDDKCTSRSEYKLIGGDRVYTNNRGVARFDNLRGTIMGRYWGRATVILSEDESRTEETSCIQISGPDDCKFFDSFWRLYQDQSRQFFQAFQNYTLWKTPPKLF